jgi:drug/metabolite transporter (DMT)-like permease
MYWPPRADAWTGAVLSSLYSAVTVVLAFIFLGERVGWLQGPGIVAALAAILLLAHS